MKVKTLKTAALCLAFLMMLQIMAGCGKSDDAPDISRGSAVTLNGDKIYPIQCDDTLEYWVSASTTWSHKFENFGETPLAKKLDEVTGVKVEYVHPNSGQENEQIQILMASDDLPDLVTHSWNKYPGGPDAAIADGYILNLNDLIDKYAPALKAALATDDFWNKQVKTDAGSYYAFPVLSHEGINQVTYGPTLRADLLKKFNLQTPTTIAEWESVLKSLKENGVESPFIGNLNMVLTAFTPGFGVYNDWYQNDGKVVYGYMEPGMKEALKTLNKWYNEGLIDPDIASVDGKTLQSKILNGQAASTLMWCGSGIGTYLNAETDREKFDLVGTQFPALKSGENSEYGYMGVTALMTNGVAISNKCVNPELAARFLDFGYTEEGQILYNFGIEGESFNWVEKDGEKYPLYTDAVMKNPDGLSVAQSLGLYVRAVYSAPYISDPRHLEQYYATTQQQEAQKSWAKSNMNSHLLPELYIVGADSDRDGEIMPVVKTYVDEMMLKFITGSEPIENFDKYVEQLKAFGIEESIAFRQEALERFNSR